MFFERIYSDSELSDKQYEENCKYLKLPPLYGNGFLSNELWKKVAIERRRVKEQKLANN